MFADLHEAEENLNHSGFFAVQVERCTASRENQVNLTFHEIIFELVYK